MTEEVSPENPQNDENHTAGTELNAAGGLGLDSSKKSSEETLINLDSKSLKKPLMIVKVLFFAFVAGVFIISLFFNISILLTPENQDFSSSNGISFLLVAASLLVTAISMGVSFWMYYVRSIYVMNGPALVPEKWGMILGELSEVTTTMNRQSVTSLETILHLSQSQIDRTESLLENFLTLQDAISVRDNEIERLKKGHDAKVFKRFLMRFIRVSRALREIHDESVGTEQERNLKYIVRLMEDALEECGVELFSPELGTDYREAGAEISDDPRVIRTVKPELDYSIASIESVAYVIQGEGDLQVIVPAKVTIYRLQQDEQGDN